MGKDLSQSQLEKFGERINKIRTRKKLSFRKLAQLCNIDYSDLSKIEKGQINITILTLIELAKGLDVHPKELLDVEFE
jgi:transcriptional regulator with XRE-family HTH domain